MQYHDRHWSSAGILYPESHLHHFKRGGSERYRGYCCLPATDSYLPLSRPYTDSRFDMSENWGYFPSNSVVYDVSNLGEQPTLAWFPIHSSKILATQPFCCNDMLILAGSLIQVKESTNPPSHRILPLVDFVRRSSSLGH